MSSFRINFGSGDDFVQSLMTLTATIQSSLEDLNSKVQPTLHDWEGTTRDAYYAHKANWDAAAGNMATGLQTGGKTMAAILELHSSNEGHLTNHWNS
jgi:WXG100 family type VII secretion target